MRQNVLIVLCVTMMLLGVLERTAGADYTGSQLMTPGEERHHTAKPTAAAGRFAEMKRVLDDIRGMNPFAQVVLSIGIVSTLLLPTFIVIVSVIFLGNCCLSVVLTAISWSSIQRAPTSDDHGRVVREAWAPVDQVETTPPPARHNLAQRIKMFFSRKKVTPVEPFRDTEVVRISPLSSVVSMVSRNDSEKQTDAMGRQTGSFTRNRMEDCPERASINQGS